MNIIYFLIIISAILAVFILRSLVIEVLKSNTVGRTILKYKKPFFVLGAVMLCLSASTVLVISVPIGTSGVVTSGFNIGEAYDQGIHLRNPFNEIEIVPWYTQNMELTMQVNSRDSIPVYINLKLSYNINKNHVSNVRINYPDYKSIIEESARSITSDYSSGLLAVDLAGVNKMVFTSEVRNTLDTVLSSISVNLVVLNIESIMLPESYQIAIIREKSAEKEKQAAILIAEGNAEVIAIVNAQLANVSSSYLQWEYIKALTNPESNIQWILPSNNFNFQLQGDE